MLALLVFIGLYPFGGGPRPTLEGCPPESELITNRYNATIRENCYRRGTHINHGPLRLYDLSGRLSYETFYTNDVLDGLTRIWDDGILRSRRVFRAGKEVGFTVNRDLKRGGHFESYGYRELPPEAGIYRQWFWRGPKDTWYNSVASFKGGRRHGRHWDFHKNGRLHVQKDYFEGELMGRMLAWDDSGRFKSGTCYDEQQLIRIWSTSSYEEAITRPCPPEERLGKDLLPVGDHRVPPPSAATHDLVPPDVQADFPDLKPPTPPPYPPGPDDVGPPEVEPAFDPEDR